MKNEKGFSLVEVMVYSGIAGVVMLAAYSLLKTTHNMQSVSSTFNALNDARTMITENFKSDVSFTKTMAAPVNAGVFSCLNNQTNCASGGGKFTLLDQNGNDVPFSAGRNTPSDGLTPRGAKCTTFDLVNGNDACPFSYVVTWKPRCSASSNCINPVVELKATLVYKPANGQSVDINTTSYDIIHVKSNLTAKLSQTCIAMGGTPGSDNTCVQAFTGQCGQNEYIVGFTATGQKICKYLAGYKCPQGQVLLGVDMNGIAQCGPGCEDPVGSASGTIW